MPWIHRGNVPARVRSLALLCALFVLFSSASARAAAPLCDPQAQSIAAPTPSRLAPEYELRALRCANQTSERFDRAPLAPAQQPELTLDLGQRVLPVGARLAIGAPRSHAERPAGTYIRPPHGFDTQVYRPPRG